MTATVHNWRDHVVATSTGCLEWQGRIDANGYSRIGAQWGHRAVYEHEVGPIPAGHDLDHVCVNPPCVNADHLDPVTRAEHVRRTMERLGKDELHGKAAYLRTIGLTYDEIAQLLDYQNRGSAALAVRSAIRKGLVDAEAVPPAERLTEADRQDIRDLRAVGIPVGDIALWYDLDPAHVSRVSRGLRSGHRRAS